MISTCVHPDRWQRWIRCSDGLEYLQFIYKIIIFMLPFLLEEISSVELFIIFLVRSLKYYNNKLEEKLRQIPSCRTSKLTFCTSYICEFEIGKRKLFFLRRGRRRRDGKYFIRKPPIWPEFRELFLVHTHMIARTSPLIEILRICD